MADIGERLAAAEARIEQIHQALTSTDGNGFGGRLKGLEDDVEALERYQARFEDAETWDTVRMIKIHATQGHGPLRLSHRECERITELIEGEWGDVELPADELVQHEKAVLYSAPEDRITAWRKAGWQYIGQSEGGGVILVAPLGTEIPR